MTERHHQGLCYNCDEQYVRGHKCLRLFYLEVADPDDEVPNLMDEPSASIEDEPLISQNAITSIRSQDTMQVRITVGTQEFTALLDSGSATNFISTVVGRGARLHFQRGNGAYVRIANRDRVDCRGVAHDVVIRIRQEEFLISCFVIPLDCYGMVLGVSSLHTLGPILWDFDDLCMAFWHQGSRVLWKGLGSPHSDIPLTGHLHTMRHDGPTLLAILLKSFDDVFSAPSGLPLARPCDHWIHLKPNTAPVEVRPYHYPHLQKDELKAQCTHMLTQGIIRPSISPFSVPVLIVKKLDESWRFCVDYRDLNECTVKDKFPIPVVKELLDELHGARFFTKLDLRSGYHQVRVHLDDIEKMAFHTHHSHFKFLVMQFGLSNALATFQALMNLMLWSFLHLSVLVFFDNILISSSS
jgi:hypothetical protein